MRFRDFDHAARIALRAGTLIEEAPQEPQAGRLACLRGIRFAAACYLLACPAPEPERTLPT